jgi:hypothetical protein
VLEQHKDEGNVLIRLYVLDLLCLIMDSKGQSGRVSGVKER